MVSSLPVSEEDNPADFLHWDDGFLVMTGSVTRNRQGTRLEFRDP
jgi:hypothetical protein